MFSPECARFSLGSPLIAVEALLELRDLLDALQVPSGCDKGSLQPSPREGINEAARQTTRPADESIAPQHASSNRSQRQAKRTGAGTDGATDQRAPRKPCAPRKKRGRR